MLKVLICLRNSIIFCTFAVEKLKGRGETLKYSLQYTPLYKCEFYLILYECYIILTFSYYTIRNVNLMLNIRISLVI